MQRQRLIEERIREAAKAATLLPWHETSSRFKLVKMNTPRNRGQLIFVALAAALALSSCHHTPAAKHYQLTGRVLTIDIQSHSVVIDGDDIPGFMEAMAMSYHVKSTDQLKPLSVGDSISADLIDTQQENTNGEPSSWIENIKVTAHSKTPPAPQAALRTPSPGGEVPDFSFTNQSGKKVSLHQYRGKFLLITFIYTRCPFPDFCPRVSASFAEINKQLPANAHLLSISFDPEHDTPKVLRDYAFSVAHTHDPALFQHWEFAVPQATDLPKIAGFFALTVKPEGGLITHDLSTTVIGPDGKIVNWYHGSDWHPSDLIKDVASN